MRAAYNFSMLRGRKPSSPAPYFGRRLAAFRAAKGLTQYQLAEALGITRNLVVYYERAAKNPSLETVQKIADFFGVTVGEMLNDTAPALPAKPGPAAQIVQLAERAAKLPRSEQKVVIKMLEGVLANAR